MQRSISTPSSLSISTTIRLSGVTVMSTTKRSVSCIPSFTISSTILGSIIDFGYIDRFRIKRGDKSVPSLSAYLRGKYSCFLRCVQTCLSFLLEKSFFKVRIYIYLTCKALNNLWEKENFGVLFSISIRSRYNIGCIFRGIWRCGSFRSNGKVHGV